VLVTLGICGSVLSARALGPHGRGILAAAIVWSNLAGVLVQCGLPQALTYATSRQPGAAGPFVAAGLLLTSLQAGVVAAAGTSLWLGGTVDSVWAAAALFAAAQLGSTQVAAMFQGLQNWSSFHALRLAAASAYPAAVVVVLGTSREATPFSILAVSAGLAACAALGGAGMLLWRVRPSLPGRAELAALAQYSARSYFANVANYLNSRLDQLMLSVLLSAEGLGYYVVAVSLSSPLMPVGAGFASIAFVRAAAPAAAQNARRSAGAVIRTASLASAAVAALLFIATPFIVRPVFGSAFGPAVVPALVLIPAGWVLSCNYVLSDTLRGWGRPGRVGLAELVGAAVTVAAMSVLVMHFAAVGAAVAALCSALAVHAVLRLNIERVEKAAASPRYA
jgi:O-antigen/teichoic acid export membrane protein